MNRFVAILVPVVVVLLIFANALIEVSDTALGWSVFLWSMALNVLMTLIPVIYCGFAAAHAVYYVQDPEDRVKWLVYTILVNLFGSLYYYLTKYQEFRAGGKGSLRLRRRKSQ